jgi:hypothetical protein
MDLIFEPSSSSLSPMRQPPGALSPAPHALASADDREVKPPARPPFVQIGSPTASEMDFAARTALESTGPPIDPLPSYSASGLGEGGTSWIPVQTEKEKVGFKGLRKDLFGLNRQHSVEQALPALPPKDVDRWAQRVHLKHPPPSEPPHTSSGHRLRNLPKSNLDSKHPPLSPTPLTPRQQFRSLPPVTLDFKHPPSSPAPSSLRSYQLDGIPASTPSVQEDEGWPHADGRSEKSESTADSRPSGLAVARDLRRILTVIEGKGNDSANASRSRHFDADLTHIKRELQTISSKLRSTGSEAGVGSLVDGEDQPNLADKSEWSCLPY